jgi:hypothetical protein
MCKPFNPKHRVGCRPLTRMNPTGWNVAPERALQRTQRPPTDGILGTNRCTRRRIARSTNHEILCARCRPKQLQQRTWQ